jgi:hypothetical protein
MSNQDEPDWIKELKSKLPADLIPLLEQRDGSAKLLRQLPIAFPPEDICTPTDQQRAWELVGLFYLNQKRIYEALPIFSSLYDHMLSAQERKRMYCHKGMPLVWIAECYSRLGFPALTKRYLMLTLCEDAIRGDGEVSPEQTGIYFRLVWGHGLPDEDLKRYSKSMFQIYKQNEVDGRFPEWILQELDQDWMREFTSPSEAVVYASNTRYIKYLIPKLGDKTGENLERLAEYILSCMPGCKTRRRGKSRSTDYDIVCSMEGLEVDFRSEFGRYFVCECKDWERAADFTTMAKFCRVLDSMKSRFGILFSKKGISGIKKTTNAAREQLKVFQDRGMVIVVVDMDDLNKVANGNNFINMLRTKYESVRLDLYKLD